MTINVYRHNKLISLWEASNRSGVPYATLYRRYRKGVRGKELFTKQTKGRPVKRTYLYKGKRYSARELAEIQNVPVATIYSRLRRKKL